VFSATGSGGGTAYRRTGSESSVDSAVMASPSPAAYDMQPTGPTSMYGASTAYGTAESGYGSAGAVAATRIVPAAETAGPATPPASGASLFLEAEIIGIGQFWSCTARLWGSSQVQTISGCTR
jgi:hypothetical protein